MRAFLISMLALGAMGTAANAEPAKLESEKIASLHLSTEKTAPVKLSRQQMDQVVAGRMTRTTTNPGGQTSGCSGGNPNCTTVVTNPSGHPPPGQQ